MSTVWFLWRLFFVLVLVRVALGFVFSAIKMSSMGAFGTLLFAAAALILAAIVISPDLARLAARPFTAFIDSIYLPGGTEKKPPLDFTLAEHYLRTLRPELAEAEYARILRHYPGQLAAYLGMAEACYRMGDREAAERELDRASRRFRKRPEALEAVGAARLRFEGEAEGRRSVL